MLLENIFFMEQLKKLFTTYYNIEPESVVPIAGSGSARRYYRLAGEAVSAIGVVGPDRRENETFIRLARAFRSEGLPVPEVYAVSADRSRYLQQDLGDTSLFSLLGGQAGEAPVEATMRSLPGLQLARSVTDDMLYPVKMMSGEQVMDDLNYFRYCFLKAVGVESDAGRLMGEFREIVARVEQTPAELRGLMLRDCQSRNVMVSAGRPVFIDFQSARRGPLLYDVASFLWQARAGFSREFRARMAEVYVDELSRRRRVERQAASDSLQLMVLIRTLQVLGAYGLRGLTQRKAHFLQSLPAVLGNIRELAASPQLEGLPELCRCLNEVVDGERFRVAEPRKGRLLVSVMSFSYKQGYPDDFTGNGGGFMFDCRAMHNPGRYERYKPLTGRDREVIDFLEERGEVQQFLAGAMSLVKPAAGRYAERGFTHLQVGFGCTGGRHRSVYCAEHLARMLRESFPADKVEILLLHREQHITERL